MKTGIFLLTSMFGAVAALAGPARPVVSSSFLVQTSCGPTSDPMALQGQWFSTTNGIASVNAWEYCDDTNSLSIAGVVQGITYGIPGNPLSNIMAFDVLVTVRNELQDAPASLTATNSHGEVQGPQAVFGNPSMLDARITAEFAIADASMPPPSQAAPPYWLDPVSGNSYFIEAVNEDLRAWYCWDPNSGQLPAGKFQVPAWNLVPSTIPPGGTAQAFMQFVVTGGGMPISDYRHSVIRASQANGWDVLYNRHPSLKISHWLDTLLIDNGYVFCSTPPAPWWEGDPVEHIYASDASVFYNLEEEPEYSHKMHYPQLPDPNGWDVRACSVPPTDPDPDGLHKVLADDFMCTSNGLINHITFWGSWFSNMFDEAASYQGITNIHLSIHADIPAGEVADWSMPQIPPLWQIDFDPSAPPAGWIVLPPQEEDPSLQGWYDPNIGMWQTNNHTRYFRYDIFIPIQMAFEQIEGTIYWLDISVDTEIGLWGWKTSVSPHFNDDAVWADLPVTNLYQWKELRDPITEESLDLAFIIDEYEEAIDWGDAPDSVQTPQYPTLAANNGANHTVIPGMYLGAGVDGEPDGQPDPQALGDDNNINGLGGIAFPPGDEDGVAFTQLVPGMSATITVTASVAGMLDAWIDFNADGDWNDPGEQIFSSKPLSAGVNNFNIVVPTGAFPSPSTFARFRYSLTGGLAPFGPAPTGEIEDYQVAIDDPFDWGDAPDPTYPTIASSGGAYHKIGSLKLGTFIDPDPDGQPAINADGDDLDIEGNDDDGITFLTPMIPGASAQINVQCIYAGGFGYKLDGWIDFNCDGDWSDPGEQIFASTSTGYGSQNLTFPVPTNAIPATNTYARFRASFVTGLGPGGYGGEGEVEDYMIFINEAQDIDWGDAPEQPYPTTLANNGAHHVMAGGFLGTSVDSEPDGQPTSSADGDDLDIVYPPPIDDEDGVILTSVLMPGGYATLDVIASAAGMLDAWVDFDNNGTWADSNNRIFASQPLNAGTNSLTFPVPASAAQGNAAYARFRFTSGGIGTYTGLAMEGEVEDYEFYITPIPDQGVDWGDAPDPTYPTLNSSGGARHGIAAGVMLGASIDSEANGQPNAQATGDDSNNLDDEDGVTFTSRIISGSNATVSVVAGTAGGMLDAWIDFNADGDWNDAGEQIAASTPVSAGLNSLSFAVPGLPARALGPAFARFRISSAGGLPPTSFALDGEVEDYPVELYQPLPVPGIEITNLFFKVSNTVAQVEWNAQSNITYQLQSSTNLATNVWTDVGGWLLGPVNWQTNSMAPAAQFYRVTAPWSE